MDGAGYKIELLATDQWGMYGLLRVTKITSGLSVSIPYFPGYGQYKARTLAFALIELAMEDTRE